MEKRNKPDAKIPHSFGTSHHFLTHLHSINTFGDLISMDPHVAQNGVDIFLTDYLFNARTPRADLETKITHSLSPWQQGVLIQLCYTHGKDWDKPYRWLPELVQTVHAHLKSTPDHFHEFFLTLKKLDLPFEKEGERIVLLGMDNAEETQEYAQISAD